MKIYFWLFFLFLCPKTLYAQEISYPEKTKSRYSSFELHIKGIPEIKGEIRIAMFDSEEAYKKKKKPLFAVVLPVKETRLTWLHEDLPYGAYAIAVYHDKNKNRELDSNILGMPKEAYGFSNNARGRFGPASWYDAHFQVSSAETTQNIVIN